MQMRSFIGDGNSGYRKSEREKALSSVITELCRAVQQFRKRGVFVGGRRALVGEETSERMALRRLLFLGAVVMVVLGSAEAAVGERKDGLDARLDEEDRYYMSYDLKQKDLNLDALNLTPEEKTVFNEMVRQRRKGKRRLYAGLPATIIGSVLAFMGLVLFRSEYYGLGIPMGTVGTLSLAGGLGALIHGPTFEGRAARNRVQLSKLLKERLEAETKKENVINQNEQQESLPNDVVASNRNLASADVPQQHELAGQ